MTAASSRAFGGPYDEFTSVAWSDGSACGKTELCQIDFTSRPDLYVYLMHPKEIGK